MMPMQKPPQGKQEAVASCPPEAVFLDGAKFNYARRSSA
ncbi:hypothetical protein B8V81_3280 [Paenibacillus pasadenensis]|uniref:Uncharacterized protein n=1 Tax=Paenibacillus pasadenensis TaxID=217090 RepID=A0A2N5N3G7_9BACL|nr:hypothetical protein B8V81_3280 [Paenibacillus pasadenensis]